jgi:hypothetical protein
MPISIPSGGFLKLNAGPLEARVFQQTGHISLSGRDLSGAALATTLIFAPASGKSSIGAFEIGRVISSAPVPDGLVPLAARRSSRISQIFKPREVGGL